MGNKHAYTDLAASRGCLGEGENTEIEGKVKMEIEERYAQQDATRVVHIDRLEIIGDVHHQIRL